MRDPHDPTVRREATEATPVQGTIGKIISHDFWGEGLNKPIPFQYNIAKAKRESLYEITRLCGNKSLLANDALWSVLAPEDLSLTSLSK